MFYDCKGRDRRNILQEKWQILENFAKMGLQFGINSLRMEGGWWDDRKNELNGKLSFGV